MSSLPSYQTDMISRTQELLKGARSVTLSRVQRATLVEPDIKGPSWVSRTSFSAPKDETNGPLSLLEQAIEALGDGKDQYARPSIESIDARWTGHRTGVGEEEPESPASEQQKYWDMMKDTKSSLTIMYCHGGGFTFVLSLFIHGTATHAKT